MEETPDPEGAYGRDARGRVSRGSSCCIALWIIRDPVSLGRPRVPWETEPAYGWFDLRKERKTAFAQVETSARCRTGGPSWARSVYPFDTSVS
jgi:hypothetical protein